MEILTWFRNFSIIWPKSKFFENFTKIEIFCKFSKKWKIVENLIKKNLSNFRKNFDLKSKYFKKFTKIEIFGIWPKSKFFENFDQNRNCSKVFEIFDKNRYFSNVLTKNWNFTKIWPIRNFWKILLKSTLFKIFENFDHQNWNFVRKFWQKSKIVEHFIKIDIFRDFRNFDQKSKYLVKFDQNRNFGKLYQNRNFRPFWRKSKFFQKIEQNFFEILTKLIFFKNLTKIENFRNFQKHRNFSSIWPKSKFFEKFHQNRNFR